MPFEATMNAEGGHSKHFSRKEEEPALGMDCSEARQIVSLLFSVSDH